MADLVVDDSESPQRLGKEEESWEDEVNMDVFYTDAAKYWKVHVARRCGLLQCVCVFRECQPQWKECWVGLVDIPL